MNLLASTESQGKFSLLVYDVPIGTRVSPPVVLRRFGVRINLSCWLIPEPCLALVPIDGWRQAGVDVEVARFDSADAANIQRLARKGLALECEKIKERLSAAKKKAVDEYRRVCTDNGIDGEHLRKADGQTYWGLRRAKRALAAAQEAALAFDLLGDVKELLDGLRAAIVSANESMLVTRKAAVSAPVSVKEAS
jgi:hypothetical protein